MNAEDVIRELGLAPHPEGGWFRETWRAEAAANERSAGTAIFYLLEKGQRSHWHRIDATELWLYQGGGRVRLETISDSAGRERWIGPDPGRGELLQVVVQSGEWQAADTQDAWALVACVVVPGFEFSVSSSPAWLESESDLTGEGHRADGAARTARANWPQRLSFELEISQLHEKRPPAAARAGENSR